MIFGTQGYSSASWLSPSEYGQLVKTSTDSLVLQFSNETQQQNVLQYQVASDTLKIALGENIKSLFRGEGKSILKVRADKTTLDIEKDTMIMRIPHD